MPKSTETTYTCEICKTKPDQLSHNKKHCESESHKDKCKIFKLTLNKNTVKKLKELYPDYKNLKTKKQIIDKIVEDMSSVKHVVEKKLEIIECQKYKPSSDIDFNLNVGINSREEMKNRVHSLHNFLRNNGAGYGMNALKMFSLFYGLNKIEDNKHFEKTGLDECCKFSKIKKLFEENMNIGFENITKNVLRSLYKNDKFKHMLYFQIPEQIAPTTLKKLIDEVDALFEIEKSENFQLAGKIYEYFIGRDQSAISELGAYFTDRHITTYIYEEVLKPTLDEHEHVREMIDMFGGSGGFTLGYMDYLIKNFNINWEENQNKISHYDMNIDVVKYAMLEYYCLTGEFAKKEFFNDFNSFTNDFNKKYHYVITNPPYGGDSVEKNVKIKIMVLIKKEINEYFKDKYKIKTMANLKKIKITENEKNKVKQFNYYSKEIKKFETEEAAKNVSLITSSDQLQNYGEELKEYGLKPENCKDKESVSLLLMMVVLKEGGTSVGVLKEGVFFAPKYDHVRKALIEKFKVEKIVSIDANQFENTKTKTSIIKFSNTGKTERIEFYDLTVEKDKNFVLKENDDGTYEIDKIKDRITSVKENHLTSASYEDIVKNDYTLNHKKYNIKEIVPGDDYKIINFLENSKFLKKSKRKASEGLDEGIFKFYVSGEKIKYLNTNDYKKLSVIIGTGGNGSLNIDNKFSCSTDNFIIKYNNDNLTKYMYFILKQFWFLIQNLMNGSTINHITKDLLKDLKIPIPKSEDKMIEWVDKISEPYNKVIENKNKLKELEEQVKQDIQNMNDTNECDDIKLGDLCEFKSGKFNSNDSKKIGKYPFYSGKSNNPDGFIDKFCFNYDNYLILLKDGGAGKGKYGDQIGLGKVFKVKGKSGSTCHQLALIIKNNLHIDYLYFILTINKNKIMDLAEYTTNLGTISKKTLENFKIKIPKDKSLIDSLNPTFNEIYKLNEEIPKQEKLYQQYLNELKSEAIKED